MKYLLYLRLLAFLLCSITVVVVMASPDKEEVSDEQIIKEILAAAADEFNKDNYPLALQLYIQYIQKAEEYPELYRRDLAVAYMRIGNIYFLYSDYEFSDIYYKKGYELAVLLKEPELEFKFLNNMVGINYSLKNTGEAIEYNNKLKELPISDKHLQEYIYILNKGYIAINNEEPDSAIQFYHQSIELYEKYQLISYLNFLAASYSEIYQLYDKKGELDSAIYFLEKYNQLAEEHGLANMIVDSNKGLMHLYTKKGEHEKAVYYQERYHYLSDSLLNARDFLKIKSEHQMYEDSRKNEKIEDLNFTISKQKMVLFFIIAVLVIALLFIILIYSQKRRLQEAYKNIYERNKELIKVENQYRALLKEHKESKEENKSKLEQKVTDDERTYLLLSRINEIMESTDEFCNADFSLVMLAKMVDSNTKYVSQVINDTYNKNFRTFINEYRIKEARRRLMDNENYGNYTIQGIAESVGYKSSTNFIIAFKKFTGITPSLYQKMSKTEDKGHN